MKGAPPEFPALDRLAGRFDQARLANIIREGTGRMPSFRNIGEPAIKALSAYLLKKQDSQTKVASAGGPASKYVMDGYNQFRDQDGYPAITPPWGTLNAINLDTGQYAWKIPFGEYPELVAEARQKLSNLEKKEQIKSRITTENKSGLLDMEKN